MNDSISIGCAGGIDITGATEYPEIKKSREVSFEISISGLNGGHSGMYIHKGLGNANKLLNRVLLQLESDINFNLVSFQGGNLRNAIPREAKAGISLDLSEIQKFDNSFADIIATLTKEFQIQEKNLKIAAVKIDNPQLCMSPDFQKTLLRTIAAIHNGVFSMNAKIPELVETSNNLARITVSKGNLEIACLTRSFSESGKTNLVNSIQSVFELAGFNSKISGDYPGWEPNPNTEICSIFSSAPTPSR